MFLAYAIKNYQSSLPLILLFILPLWSAVMSPGLCRRFPGQNRGVSERTGTHRSAPGITPGMHRRKPGHTVINFCPKPGLVRSTAGNIWTHSNSVPFRPGSPRSVGCKLPGRTRTCERGFTPMHPLAFSALGGRRLPVDDYRLTVQKLFCFSFVETSKPFKQRPFTCFFFI